MGSSPNHPCPGLEQPILLHHLGDLTNHTFRASDEQVWGRVGPCIPSQFPVDADAGLGAKLGKHQTLHPTLSAADFVPTPPSPWVYAVPSFLT